MSEKLVLVVDSQKLETIQLCWRKYYYSYVRNLVPPEPAEYLERGSLVHTVLEKYYSNGKDMRAAVHESYKKSVELNLDPAECEIVFNNMLEYGKHYEGDMWEVASDDHGPLIERAAYKTLFEDEHFRFDYQGLIDLQIFAGRDPETIIVDHKHAKKRGSLSELNNQFIGYCWLMGKFKLYKNEIGFQKSLKPKERFVRYLMCYDPDRIEEWVDNAVDWLKHLAFNMAREGWPMNWSSCNKFDGCIFSGLCTTTPDAREYRIKRDFKVTETPWDVGSRLTSTEGKE